MPGSVTPSFVSSRHVGKRDFGPTPCKEASLRHDFSLEPPLWSEFQKRSLKMACAIAHEEQREHGNAHLCFPSGNGGFWFLAEQGNLCTRLSRQALARVRLNLAQCVGHCSPILIRCPILVQFGPRSAELWPSLTTVGQHRATCFPI